jgi:hypothetical protein
MTQRSKLQSPERLAIVAELWGTMTPTREILELLNAAPGPEGRVTNDQAHRWGVRAGVYRPKNLSSAQRMATVRGNFARPDALSSEEREPILRALVTDQWPYERLETLCVDWNLGKLTAEIAYKLGCARGAIIGKARRLAEAGAIVSRLSPIHYQDPPESGWPSRRATRPEQAPAPKPVTGRTTLAPLASLAGELLEDEAWTPPARARSCQFVVCEGSGGQPWELCGQPLADGSRAWCDEHRLLAVDVAAMKRSARRGLVA